MAHMHNRLPYLARCVVCLSFALSACAGSALAGDTTPEEASRKPPGVIVSFEGGVVGDNVAYVLQSLIEQPDGLPTETYTVQPNDTACGILDARGYPPPCPRMLNVLDRLNRARPPSKSPLKPGDTLVLPMLNIKGYRPTKTFSLDNPREVARQGKIQQNWKRLNPSLLDAPPDTSKIAYDAYQLFIPTASDEASLKLVSRLAPLRSTNVLVDMLKVAPSAVKLYSSAPKSEDYKIACETGTAVTDMVMYQDYADADRDALTIVKNGLPQSQQTVPVYLIDTPLLESPNLYPAYGAKAGAQPWKCKWNSQFSAVHHHATHLAGILASQGNGFGFVGLYPQVKIQAFPWIVLEDGKVVASPERAFQLAELISMNERGGQSLGIYLAAVGFDKIDPQAVKLSDGHFQNAEQRFFRPLQKRIREARPLLIVAAGQAEDENTEVPVNLSPTSTESPQNLGDLENVIVVTACTKCSQGQTRLLPMAWYSSTEPRIVHVAAPGGRRGTRLDH